MRLIDMAHAIDLTGQRFSRLVVIEQAGRLNANVVWKCNCDCGNTIEVRSNCLRRGVTKSCGCFQRECLSKARKTHGLSDTREYRIWKGLRQRCDAAKVDVHEYYAARGITVCDRWNDFTKFYEDMGPCPDGYSIDRIDYDKGYEPSNCRWADDFLQAKNRRMFRSNTSNVIGVSWAKDRQQWATSIMRKNKVYRLGYFDVFEDAVAARKKAELFLDSPPLSDTSAEVRLSA